MTLWKKKKGGVSESWILLISLLWAPISQLCKLRNWDCHPTAPLLVTGMPVIATTFNSISQDGRPRASRENSGKFVEGGVRQRSRGISSHTTCLYTPPTFPSKLHLRVENGHSWLKT